MSVRSEKIAKLIKEEISLIFLHKIQDPALGLITITNVKMSPDLKLAKVYFSAFEREKRDEIYDKINQIKGLIRSELAHRVRLRYVPELDFYIDDTQDYVEKMDNLFKQINKNDQEESN